MPSVQETIVSTSGGTYVGMTDVYEGVIESVNDVKTVGAVTFSTVRARQTQASGADVGSYFITWADPVSGLFILEEVSDEAGTLIGWVELTDIN